MALGLELDQLIGEQLVFVLALNLLGSGRIHLRAQGVHALADLIDLRLNAREDRSRRAMPLFKAGNPRHVQRGCSATPSRGAASARRAARGRRKSGLRGQRAFHQPQPISVLRRDDAVFLFAALCRQALKFCRG